MTEMFKAFRVLRYEAVCLNKRIYLESVASLPAGWRTSYTPGVQSTARGDSYFYCFDNLADATLFAVGGWVSDVDQIEVWKVAASQARKAVKPIVHIHSLDKWFTGAEAHREAFERYWSGEDMSGYSDFSIAPPQGTVMVKSVIPLHPVFIPLKQSRPEGSKEHTT